MADVRYAAVYPIADAINILSKNDENNIYDDQDEEDQDDEHEQEHEQEHEEEQQQK